jgi:type I restriction enzyme R subunit
MADFTELFKQYSDNPAFKRWLSERNFGETYRPVGVGAPG